jgi:hypothetical protein
VATIRHRWYGIVIAILFSTPFQAGEEVGWRGYPRYCLRTKSRGFAPWRSTFRRT